MPFPIVMYHVYNFHNTIKHKRNIKILEIRSMERGICPIAVFYFALKRSFFNI